MKKVVLSLAAVALLAVVSCKDANQEAVEETTQDAIETVEETAHDATEAIEEFAEEVEDSIEAVEEEIAE